MSANLTQLQDQKRALLAGLDDWSSERLHYRPSNGGWSTIQVIDHLIKTEREIQERVREGLQTPHRIGLRDRVGTVFLTRVFRSNRKVEVPASARSILPDPEPQLLPLLFQWNQSRQDLAALTDALLHEQQHIGVFRHTVAGWMSLSGVLDFFSVHMHHHGFQLKTLSTLSEGL